MQETWRKTKLLTPYQLLTMKKLYIIYWKSRNYNWIEFMDYSLIEKSSNENLMIKWYDFMRTWETKKETKRIFDFWQETQKNKLERAGYNYRNVIHELRYTIQNKHLHLKQ